MKRYYMDTVDGVAQILEHEHEAGNLVLYEDVKLLREFVEWLEQTVKEQTHYNDCRACEDDAFWSLIAEIKSKISSLDKRGEA